MIPKSKKNLHACKYHLENILSSKHFEEVEINFAAFVNAARSTTFVLQKEYKGKQEFTRWYGNPENPDGAPRNSKLYEMKNDELCRFFLNLRNQIVKEGINNLHCTTRVSSMNTSEDFPDQPVNATLVIGTTGIYYHIAKGTAKEDRIPAISRTAKIMTDIYIANAPTKHLGKVISNPNLPTLANLYYEYLRNLVEEWTDIINSID